jgi:ribosomal protein S12 methylthiotransferase accessory factor YcaO
MEIVERCAAFASVRDGRVQGTAEKMPLFRGTFSDLSGKGGIPPLDPNRIRLEAPYENEPLYWVKGFQTTEKKADPILVPFQAVFLFANLDEVSLFSSLGSTGLAAGATPAQARLSALLEVIERDCEATGLFHPSRCFRITARDPFIAGLLADYSARGIDVFFQDITGFTGVPCYKALVIDRQGRLCKGTGAHLDGRYALLSALTETPHPYPGGAPSCRGPEDLPVKTFEALPDLSSASLSADLSRVEAALDRSGFPPIYVDLTRRDLGFPVVRAVVPGLEISADFSPFSRVSPRLYRAYLDRAGTRPGPESD